MFNAARGNGKARIAWIDYMGWLVWLVQLDGRRAGWYNGGIASRITAGRKNKKWQAGRKNKKSDESYLSPIVIVSSLQNAWSLHLHFHL